MRKILLVVLAVFCLESFARADNFKLIGSRAAQNPTDIIDWTQLGVDGTVLSTPQSLLTFNGNSVLVGNINGSTLQRVLNGASWLGNFDYGESLVWNRGATAPFLMELGGGVGSFGFSIQSLAYGAFTAQVTILDCSFRTLFSQIFAGTSSNSENGSALFVGVGDTSGANICAIAISTTDANGNNSFAISDVSFTDTAYSTPQPSSLSLLGSSPSGLAAIRRHKLSVCKSVSEGLTPSGTAGQTATDILGRPPLPGRVLEASSGACSTAVTMTGALKHF